MSTYHDNDENEEYVPPKKKRFRLFDTQKEGKGITKEEALAEGTGLKRFFRLYRDNLGKLLSVNIMMVVGCFPVLFAIIAMSGVLDISFTKPASEIFPFIRAFSVSKTVLSPSDLVFSSIEGLQIAESEWTTWTYVFMGLSFLTCLTFGFVNTGSAYVTRNIIMGEPVFPYSDFFYAIKRNRKQSFFVGIFDFFVLIFLCIDFYILLSSEGTFFHYFLLWMTVGIAIIWIFMRYYLYLQIVTFDLKFKKLLKNSLIFAVLGLKRNFLALLGTVLYIFLDLIFVFGLNGILLFLGIAMPFMVLFSHIKFMGTYAAYYKIKEIMIDPISSPGQEEEN